MFDFAALSEQFGEVELFLSLMSCVSLVTMVSQPHPVFKKADGSDYHHEHVDNETETEEGEARVTDFVLNDGIGNEHSEEHQVVHYEKQLDLIEGVHLLIKRPRTGFLNIIIHDQNRYRCHH